MKDFLKLLNQRPIAYYPIYRTITGSTTAGILLSQLMYWFSKKNKIYKTDKEIMSETLLSKKELETAKKRIKNLSFIEVTREGIPAKTYYKIDWKKYEDLLQKVYNEQQEIKEETSFPERGKQDVLNGGNFIPRMEETGFYKRGKLNTPKRGNSIPQKEETITENTTEITNTKTTTKNTHTEERKKISLFDTALNKINIQRLMKDLGIDKNFLFDLMYYREQIDKPLKTERMISALLNDLLICKVKTKRSVEEIFEIMEEQGWKTVKAEWIKNTEENKKSNYDLEDLEKFGYKPQRQDEKEIITLEAIENE